MVVGIDPEAEAAMTQLKTALRQGEYLNRDSQNCLYAGSGVAKRLKVSIGEEVSFIGAASDNSFAADIFKLCGTFKTGSFEFDSSAVFVARSYFDTLMYADNKASYITIKAADLNDVDALNQKITDVLNDAALESLTWKTLMKTMVEAMEVDSIFGYVSLALFCIIIFFVIMIYGFINVSSRIKEFGVLRCIGVSKTHLLKLLLYEIIILSTLSIVLAAPLAGALCYYYSLNPIVIEGIAQMYQDYGIISDELPFDFNLFTIAWNVALIYMLNLLSIVYPYYYINAFEPIEASRHV
jgi:ABC-type lipoprotein release transport system permease subunit